MGKFVPRSVVQLHGAKPKDRGSFTRDLDPFHRSGTPAAVPESGAQVDGGPGRALPC